MYAVIDNELNIIKLLIDKGAEVNLQDDNGYSALHFASQDYHLESAKLLLESEANVDVQDLHGNTPLFRAVFNAMGRGEMIKLLLKNGANRHLKNNHGVSPLELAHTIGNYDVIEYFE